MDAAGNAKGFAVAAFDTVKARADRVLIVASGKSATDLDLGLVRDARQAGVYILAVNRAWDWCEDIDGWFTLDPNYLVIKYMAPGYKHAARFVAIPDDYGQPDARIRYHRNKERAPSICYLQRISGDGPLKSCYELATDRSKIHTGNSAYGALGLAKHMKAERVALIGVDANRRAGYAYHEGRTLTFLSHLPLLFQSAVPQLVDDGIQVINGSPNSRVTCFPRCSPNRAVEWVMEGL